MQSPQGKISVSTMRCAPPSILGPSPHRETPVTSSHKTSPSRANSASNPQQPRAAVSAWHSRPLPLGRPPACQPHYLLLGVKLSISIPAKPLPELRHFGSPSNRRGCCHSRTFCCSPRSNQSRGTSSNSASHPASSPGPGMEAGPKGASPIRGWKPRSGRGSHARGLQPLP